MSLPPTGAGSSQTETLQILPWSPSSLIPHMCKVKVCSVSLLSPVKGLKPTAMHGIICSYWCELSSHYLTKLSENRGGRSCTWSATAYLYWRPWTLVFTLSPTTHDTRLRTHRLIIWPHSADT